MPTVWVSRPRQNAAALATALRQRGLRPLCAPAIRITAPPDTAPLQHYLATVAADVSAYAATIFISRAAALTVAEKLPRTGAPLPAFTLGAATTAALSPRYTLCATNSGIADSDTLLENPTLAKITGHIAVLGGSDTAASPISPRLVEGLRARGSSVEEIPCYHRSPAPPSPRLDTLGSAGRIDAAVAYSSDTARAMLQMTAPDNDWLRQLPLFVIHQNIAAEATQLGFTKIITTPDVAAAAAEYFA